MPVADGCLRPQLLYLKRRDSCFVHSPHAACQSSLLLQSDWEAGLRAGYFGQHLSRGNTSHADMLDSWERSPAESPFTAEVPPLAPGTVTAQHQPEPLGLGAASEDRAPSSPGRVVGLSSLLRSSDPATSSTSKESMLPPGSCFMTWDSQVMGGSRKETGEESQFQHTAGVKRVQSTRHKRLTGSLCDLKVEQEVLEESFCGEWLVWGVTE